MLIRKCERSRHFQNNGGIKKLQKVKKNQAEIKQKFETKSLDAVKLK